MDNSIIALLAENDEEIAIFDAILNTKERTYHYLNKSVGVFNLDELQDSYCFIHFRFYKADIRRLRILFRIPVEIILRNGIKVSGVEALCILLRRLAYPNRFVTNYQSIFLCSAILNLISVVGIQI